MPAKDVRVVEHFASTENHTLNQIADAMRKHPATVVIDTR